MSSHSRLPRWLPVGWLYVVVCVHLVGGVLLTWMAPNSLLDGYLRTLEQAFWETAAPAAARAQQLWWLRLFAATVQNYALYMLALVHLGHRLKKSVIWAWIIAGLALWAPQDMLISLEVGITSHVWLDAAALLALLPPLLWLYLHDRAAEQGATRPVGAALTSMRRRALKDKKS